MVRRPGTGWEDPLDASALRLTVDEAPRAAVAARAAATRAAAERTRCQMVLLAAEGLGGLATKPRSGRPRVVTPAWEAELRRVVDRSP